MKQLFFSFFFLFSLPLFSQKVKDSHHIQLSAGRSFNGSGDIRGFVFSSQYSQYFQKEKKLCWILDLSGTIHDGNLPVFFNDANNDEIDGSIRYTVAGVQLTGYAGYSFLGNIDHEIQLRLGILFRYQSSSLPDDYSILYPAFTNLPYPVVVFNNTNPQRTFAPGGSIQLHYNYNVTDKISVGILTGFQADTEGDNLSHISLSTGFRF
jgi:hypothetical protein